MTAEELVVRPDPNGSWHLAEPVPDLSVLTLAAAPRADRHPHPPRPRTMTHRETNQWGCRLGRAEPYDADTRYCHEHGGFTHPYDDRVPDERCDQAPIPAWAAR